jgi:hypothetical protein
MTNPELARRVQSHKEDLTVLGGDIVDIQNTVNRHTQDLISIKRVQDEHTAVLTEHSVVLAEHSVVLAEHSVALAELRGGVAEILRRLPAQDN